MVTSIIDRHWTQTTPISLPIITKQHNITLKHISFLNDDVRTLELATSVSNHFIQELLWMRCACSFGDTTGFQVDKDLIQCWSRFCAKYTVSSVARFASVSRFCTYIAALVIDNLAPICLINFSVLCRPSLKSLVVIFYLDKMTAVTGSRHEPPSLAMSTELIDRCLCTLGKIIAMSSCVIQVNVASVTQLLEIMKRSLHQLNRWV